MIILDTNVVSELMRERASSHVREWALAVPTDSLFTTAICETEVFHGVALLPAGKRRRELDSAAEQVFAAFENRILPFDSAAARAYADILGKRTRTGRPISMADAQIAAIARARGAAVATRNTEDFDTCGIELVDPWR